MVDDDMHPDVRPEAAEAVPQYCDNDINCEHHIFKFAIDLFLFLFFGWVVFIFVPSSDLVSFDLFVCNWK